MGSQSVTNFSAVRMKRIRQLVKDYSPGSRKADQQAIEIGAAAVGTLSGAAGRTPPAKGKEGTGAGVSGVVATGPPANEFLQALSSRSVENAIDLMMSFADEMRKARNVQEVYEKYGVETEKQQPFGAVSAFLTKAHSDRLSSTQEDTESAFAARDAIPKTIINVISSAFPREQEPVEVDRRKFADAFRKVESKEIITTLMENVTAALINLVLDATRGSLSTEKAAEIKRNVREHFVPKFVQRLKEGK
jgi:hypothetical protein